MTIRILSQITSEPDTSSVSTEYVQERGELTRNEHPSIAGPRPPTSRFNIALQPASF